MNVNAVDRLGMSDHGAVHAKSSITERGAGIMLNSQGIRRNVGAACDRTPASHDSPFAKIMK